MRRIFTAHRDYDDDACVRACLLMTNGGYYASRRESAMKKGILPTCQCRGYRPRCGLNNWSDVMKWMLYAPVSVCIYRSG